MDILCPYCCRELYSSIEPMKLTTVSCGYCLKDFNIIDNTKRKEVIIYPLENE